MGAFKFCVVDMGPLLTLEMNFFPSFVDIYVLSRVMLTEQKTEICR